MIETASYRPAKLRPILSPTELREVTVRDYVAGVARCGFGVSAPELERQAVADLEMVDAYQRGLDISPPRVAPPRKARPAPVDPAGELPFKAAPPPESRDGGLGHADLTRLSARWPFAMGRMKRILAGAQPHRDPIVVAMSCEVPELALAMLRLHRNYLMRGRDSRHNPFRGLDEVDCRRALVRFVEDLCDRSSRWMGPWWVPK